MSGPVTLLVLAMLIAGSPVAAWAHAGPMRTPTFAAALPPSDSSPLVSVTPPVWTSAQPAPYDTTTLVLIGVALAVALVMVRGRRHVVALGLSVVLVLVGFAAAVHSVHHLGSSNDADRCVLAASAERVNGVDTEAAPLTSVATVAVGRAGVDPPEWPSDTSLAPTRGRAPPAFSR
jgi:hypothetical protein